MNYKMKELKKNDEGYNDPTAYEVIKKADPDARKRYRLIGCILRICELSGYTIEGRITLRDIKTGKIYK